MSEMVDHSVCGNPNAARAREVLDLVADKWSLYVIAKLGDGEQRFTELKRSVGGISQRMLTVTLRGLERDGLITRTIYSAMPPNIAYRLTPLGATLVDATTPLVMWAIENLSSIDAARGRYDDDHVKEVHELNR